MATNTPRKHRSYSDAQRAHALAVLAAEGGNVSRAAALAQVPRKTLEQWRDAAFREAESSPKLAALRYKKKIEMGIACRELAEEMAGVLRSKIGEMSGRDLAIAIAVLTDRSHLLMHDPRGQHDVPKVGTDREQEELFRERWDSAREGGGSLESVTAPLPPPGPSSQVAPQPAEEEILPVVRTPPRPQGVPLPDAFMTLIGKYSRPTAARDEVRLVNSRPPA